MGQIRDVGTLASNSGGDAIRFGCTVMVEDVPGEIDDTRGEEDGGDGGGVIKFEGCP